jgi:hypothetical protein
LQDIIYYLVIDENSNEIIIEIICSNFDLLIPRPLYKRFIGHKRNIGDIFDINTTFMNMIITIKTNITDYYEYNCLIKFLPDIKILAEKFYAKKISLNADESMVRCEAEIFAYSTDVLEKVLSNNICMPNIKRLQVSNSTIDLLDDDLIIYFDNNSAGKSLTALMPNLFVVENIIYDEQGVILKTTIVIHKNNAIIETNNFGYDSKVDCGDFTFYNNTDFSRYDLSIELTYNECQ